MNRRKIYLSVTLLGLLTFAGGCHRSEERRGEKDDHEHSHEHDQPGKPKSLHAAITELSDRWAAISTAMDKSDLEAAHVPLHEVGEVLEAMPDLAAESDLPESEWNTIQAEAEKLFAAFGDLDSAFHQEDGDKMAAYESTKSTIDQGIAALQAKLPLLGGGAPSSNHGQDSATAE